MADVALEFKTVENLSVSDFGGSLAISKTPEGKFRSFGVDYMGEMIWTNNESWYEAWSGGQIVPGSIKLKQEKRIRNKIDPATGEVMLDPITKRKITETTDELIWRIVGLKTVKQLEGEHEITMKVGRFDEEKMIAEKTKSLRINAKVLEEHNKYYEQAKKAVDGAEISKEQEEKVNNMLAKLGIAVKS